MGNCRRYKKCDVTLKVMCCRRYSMGNYRQYKKCDDTLKVMCCRRYSMGNCRRYKKCDDTQFSKVMELARYARVSDYHSYLDERDADYQNADAYRYIHPGPNYQQ